MYYSIDWERSFRPEKLRPDNEMLSEARNIACDTQRRTNYDNVVSYIHIPLVP